MGKSEHSDTVPRGISLYRADNIRRLLEILFSANIASSLGYAFLVYISKNQARWPPVNDLNYYFLRGSFRIDDVLRIRTNSAVSTSAVARQSSSQWSQAGYEGLTVLTVFAVAALVLLLLRLNGGSSAYRSGLLGLTCPPKTSPFKS